MTGAVYKVAIGVNARPIKRHEARIVAEHLRVVAVVIVKVPAAHATRRCDDVRRTKPEPLLTQSLAKRLARFRVVVILVFLRKPAAPRTGRFNAELFS